jgi:RimJ/RimL family protein N-acetyltransferase
LGIITDPNTTRLGYATEALYTAIVFAFEKLGITKITMLTDEINQEMRGWCEDTAGLKLINKKQMEFNGYTFIECEYTFTLDQWNSSIKKKLENKMDQIKTQVLSTNN